MNSTSVTVRVRDFVTGSSSLSRHLAGAVVGSLFLNLSAKGLTLVSSILLARWLGAEGYGIYTSTMAVLLMLSVPTKLGLPTLVIRLLASYRLNEQWGFVRGLMRSVNLVVLLLALLLGGLGATVIWAFRDSLASGHAQALYWAMALLPLVALDALCSASLRGLHHVVLGYLSENLVVPGFFVTLLAIWSLAGFTLTSEIAVALRFAAVVIGLTVGVWLLLNRLPGQVRDVIAAYDMSSWIRAAIPLMFFGGMSIINTQTDILMLASVKGVNSAGVYHAAARGAELIAFSGVVVNAAIQPTLSHLYAAGELRRLQRVLAAAVWGMFALAVPVAVLLIFFGQSILGTVFGHEFERGAVSLSVLCIAQLVNVCAGSVALILNMTGHERDAAIGMGVGTLANVILNAVLIPLWDIEGAAVATGASLIIWNIVLARIVRIRTGLCSTVFCSMAPEKFA